MPTTTVNDIMRHIESLSGRPLEPDEIVYHGSADTRVTRVVTTWMPTPEAIREAAKRGAELLIGHEVLEFPQLYREAAHPECIGRMWLPNTERRRLLETHNLTFLQVHGSADHICILDEFAALLDVGSPVYEKGLVKVYEIRPTRLRDLIDRVKRQVHMDCVRVSGVTDPDQKVHRVGLPWGGYGLFANAGYLDLLKRQDCDVFIAGEACNLGFHFATELGIPMIETSHEISENPGFRRFTQMLSGAFPDVTFHFHELACAWTWY